MAAKANTTSKRTTKPAARKPKAKAEAKYPGEFVKAVKAGAKKGDRYVDICRTIEAKGIERPKGDLYNAVRTVAKGM